MVKKTHTSNEKVTFAWYRVSSASTRTKKRLDCIEKTHSAKKQFQLNVQVATPTLVKNTWIKMWGKPNHLCYFTECFTRYLLWPAKIVSALGTILGRLGIGCKRLPNAVRCFYVQLDINSSENCDRYFTVIKE